MGLTSRVQRLRRVEIVIHFVVLTRHVRRVSSKQAKTRRPAQMGGCISNKEATGDIATASIIKRAFDIGCVRSFTALACNMKGRLQTLDVAIGLRSHRQGIIHGTGCRLVDLLVFG